MGVEFSGHGAQLEVPGRREQECMDETILPVDFMSAGHIVDVELFAILCEQVSCAGTLRAHIEGGGMQKN